jgi:aryl-alcohol dehydrogenase-like predicted oxidoreductase
LRAVERTEIVCVQNLFNLANQQSLDVLTECEARNIALVPFCPLGWPGAQNPRTIPTPGRCWTWNPRLIPARFEDAEVPTAERDPGPHWQIKPISTDMPVDPERAT